MENTLSYELDAAGTDPELDNACKQLLAEKVILAWIMHSCLDEYKDIEVNEIVEKYIEGTPEIGSVGVMPEQTNRKISGLSGEGASINEGLVRYDIRFYALAPHGDELIKLIINIEAQNKYHNSYPLITRAIYYLSRMISAQHGTEFDHSRYGDIKKVYSVWICTDPPKERENTIVKYRMAEEQMIGDVKEKPENYDLMTAIIICLSEKVDLEKNNILKLLGVLLSNTMDAGSKKHILTGDFDIPMSDEFDDEVEKMCNVSAGIIEKSIAKGWKIGLEKGLAEGLEKGLTEGREKGHNEGLQKGREERTFELLSALISNTSFTFEQAAASLDIPSSEWDKYKKLIEQE